MVATPEPEPRSVLEPVEPVVPVVPEAPIEVPLPVVPSPEPVLLADVSVDGVVAGVVVLEEPAVVSVEGVLVTAGGVVEVVDEEVEVSVVVDFSPQAVRPKAATRASAAQVTVLFIWKLPSGLSLWRGA